MAEITDFNGLAVDIDEATPADRILLLDKDGKQVAFLNLAIGRPVTEPGEDPSTATTARMNSAVWAAHKEAREATQEEEVPGQLGPRIIDRIFHDCLLTDAEAKDEAVVASLLPADGIMVNVGLHPGRMDRHRPELALLLRQLHDDFMASQGGGASFLDGCLDRTGRQWTGMQMQVEQLFQLAIAAGYGEWCLPRELWLSLPGGVPYFRVLDDKLPPLS